MVTYVLKEPAGGIQATSS